MIKRYNTKASQRKARVRSSLYGTQSRPRLTVYRSNHHIYAQIINDQTGQTLVSASDYSLPKTSLKGKTKSEIASQVGQLLAKQAQSKKIKTVCFDRGQYQYHGRIKSLAQAARQEGLEF